MQGMDGFSEKTVHFGITRHKGNIALRTLAGLLQRCLRVTSDIVL